jgi:mono/diheme cytochrome c family protein
MKKPRILAASAFAAILGLGVTLYATEEHPSALFKEYCARCHGEDGKAQTPKGKQLMAQDFTDAEWQEDETDEELIGIVTKGGEDMPAFGKKLSKEQIEGLVKKDVRGFGKRQ